MLREPRLTMGPKCPIFFIANGKPKWRTGMDREELLLTYQKFKAQLAAGTERLRALEAETAQLQEEQIRLGAVVSAIQKLLDPPDPEAMKLTEAILSVVRRRPGLPAPVLAAKALGLAPSKSADPQRVAMVRIGQLVNDARLREVNGAIHPGPKA